MSAIATPQKFYFAKEIKVEEILYFAAKCVEISLSVVSLAMVFRMLLPIFVNPEDSRAYAVAFYITEPFIIPVRAIMVKFNIAQGTPFDWSFTVTYLLIWLLQMMLPVI